MYVAKDLNQFMQTNSTHAWLYILRLNCGIQISNALVQLQWVLSSFAVCVQSCMHSSESNVAQSHIARLSQGESGYMRLNVAQAGILISVPLPAWTGSCTEV